MTSQKSRSKALKIVVGVIGVISAALQGQDKDTIEVTGDGVDAVELMILLRRNVGHAELVSVAEKKEKMVKGTVLGVRKMSRLVWNPYSYGSAFPLYYIHEVMDSGYDFTCSIM